MRKVAMSHLIKTIAMTCALSTSAWVYGSGCTKHGDIQNIGNRSVSGKIWGILPNFVSFEREIALGAQVAAQFEQTARLIDDPVVSEYVDRVGQNIVKHSDAKVPFHVKVVDTDTRPTHQRVIAVERSVDKESAQAWQLENALDHK